MHSCNSRKLRFQHSNVTPPQDALASAVHCAHIARPETECVVPIVLKVIANGATRPARGNKRSQI